MEYRILGNTGLKVSAIGVGTWQLSGPLTLDGQEDGFPDPGEDAVIAMIRACGELGINFIDCAEVYGAGEGERRVGKAISGRRDNWIISSKFGLRRGQGGKRIRDPNPNNIRTSLEATLRRLATDYLDVYLYHSSPNEKQIADGATVLQSLKQQGKIRHCGISTNDFRVLQQLVAHNAVDVVMFSQSLLTHSPQILQLIKKQNLGGIVRGALESGKLSGRYFRDAPKLGEHDIRKRTFDATDLTRYAVYERLVPTGASMATFSLRYLLGFDTTHTIVLGGRTISHYQEALSAFSVAAVDGTTLKAIEDIRANLSKRSMTRRAFAHLNKFFGFRR